MSKSLAKLKNTTKKLASCPAAIKHPLIVAYFTGNINSQEYSTIEAIKFGKIPESIAIEIQKRKFI